MNGKKNANLLRLAASGILAFGTAINATALGAIAPSLLFPASALAENVDEQTNIRVYERASPAVVSIETDDSNGSGSIISPDGLVLTNAHVVEDSPDRITVKLSDGTELEAEAIAFGEEGLDLAVLKIRGGNNLPSLSIAPAGSVKVGQRAFAIGNPFGRFQGTFTVGIVSRIDSDRGLIQTDAAINPGNSGGPLLNSNGELIGVNSSIFSRGPQGGNIGIGFAISSDRVQPFLTAVREGRAPRTASKTRPAFDGDGEPEKLVLNSAPLDGRLGPGSRVLRADDSFFNVYTFEGKAGERVTIDMTSDEIDPYLILVGPNGREVAQNDDGGGGTNARIVATLPSTGTYMLIANSAQSGEAGKYSLRASGGAVGGSDRAPTGQYILASEGVLDSQASVLPSDGSLYQKHEFEGRAGQSVTIRAESSDFDTYLVLVSPSGQAIAQNDDADTTSTDSEISIILPRTGTYQAIVNSFDKEGRGRYSLTIR